MNRSTHEFFDIILRYALLVLLSIGNLLIFYLVFTPITVYSVFFLFNSFFTAMLNGTTIYVKLIPIEMIPACIAGSAYYLLLIFNLSTPGIKISRRLRMIFFSFLFFLIVNVLRIFLLGVMYISGSPIFDIAHKVSWYFGSVFLIMLIWFYQVKIYKVKEIPFYSDLRFLYKHSLLKIKK